MSYPVYKKVANGAYYKIVDPSTFVTVRNGRFFGTIHYSENTMDLAALLELRTLKDSTEEEFLKVYRKVKEQLKDANLI